MMSLLRLLTLMGIMWCVSAVYAFERIEADAPSNLNTPKHLTIQLSTPSVDAGAGCNPCGRMKTSATFGVRHGINASVATTRFAVEELSQVPRHTRESISATANSIRNFGNESVRTTDSALAVLNSLTAGILRIVSSLLSALASAIWPF